MVKWESPLEGKADPQLRSDVWISSPSQIKTNLNGRFPKGVSAVILLTFGERVEVVGRRNLL